MNNANEDNSVDEENAQPPSTDLIEKGNQEESKCVPSAIKLETEVFDIAYHPKQDVIAAGEINGQITVFAYSTEEGNRKLLSLCHNKKACRALSFSPDGAKLYSCSKDKSIKVMDMNVGTMLHDNQNAHSKAINAMTVLSENYLATGSDDGVVKIWDTRTFSVIAEHSEHTDYISDMTADEEGKYILATSGDGTLSVFNARRKKTEGVSDQQDDELLAVQIIKNKQKVVCGSSDGTVGVFSWGEWGDVSDRIPSHKDSIDCVRAITEDVVCTGSEDGVIRALFVQPHRAIGVIGKHGTLGVESMKLSHNHQLLATCSSDSTVKFWDVSFLHEETVAPAMQKKKQRKRKLEECARAKDDFFADL